MDDFDWYRLFKTLHVIAVVILGGGFVLEGIVGPLLGRARSVQEARVYGRLLFISENYLSIPAAIAIAIFGYLTAERADFALDLTWLLIGQILFYVIVVLALAILRPASNRLHRLTEATPDGPLTPEIATMVKNPLPAAVGSLTTLMYVFVIYLMVAKPNW